MFLIGSPGGQNDNLGEEAWTSRLVGSRFCPPQDLVSHVLLFFAILLLTCYP